jgi:ElaB/YqjD/DUF883 family membrane-anchored ribosome-binding protein
MAQERSDLDNFDRVDPGKDTALEVPEDRNTTGVEAAANDDGAAMTDDDTPAEAEQIMGQIEETRSQMGETIDEIQDRLSFSNLSEQVSEHVTNAVETAKDAVYEATIGKAAGLMKNVSNTTVVRTVRNNPFPFVLIGLGAGLLAYQGYTGKLGMRSRRRTYGYENAEDRTGQQWADTAQGKLQEVSDKVSNAAGTAMNKVSNAMDTAYTGATEMVNKAYTRTGELGTQAYDMYDRYLDENPLAVGAVAVALGAAVGLAIPSTRYEGELLGETRNQFLEKAESAASNFLDRAKDAVNKNVGEQPGIMAEH